MDPAESGPGFFSITILIRYGGPLRREDPMHWSETGSRVSGRSRAMTTS
jgi:hypothetical protein